MTKWLVKEVVEKSTLVEAKTRAEAKLIYFDKGADDAYTRSFTATKWYPKIVDNKPIGNVCKKCNTLISPNFPVCLCGYGEATL